MEPQRNRMELIMHLTSLLLCKYHIFNEADYVHAHSMCPEQQQLLHGGVCALLALPQ